MRLSHELSTSPNGGVFITLTYDDQHLPSDESLSVRSLQLTIKRLRKALTDYRLRYFCVGEYGDSFGRPHYHGILLNVPWESFEPKSIFINGKWQYSSDLLSSVWPYGFNVIGSVTYSSIKYVCKYVHKMLSGPKAHDIYGSKVRPFALKSMGLGKQFVIDHADQLRTNHGVTFQGKELSLPKYYKQLLYPGIENRDRVNVINTVLYDTYIDSVPGVTRDEKEAAIVRRNRGKEKIIQKNLDEQNLGGV